MQGRECNVEVFSRVTGFFRPVQAWNKGKTEEFKDRSPFNIAGEHSGTKKDNSEFNASC